MTGASEDHYWSLDVPGLAEADARRIAEWVEAEGAGWFGKASILDPRVWLTLHLDRDSAETLRAALSAREPDGGGEGLREALSEWRDWSGGETRGQGS